MSKNKSDLVPSEGLRDKVQTFRDAAREILRGEKISSLLQDLFHAERSLENTTKDLEEMKHNKKVQEYETAALDTEHPDYDKKKEHDEKRLKNILEGIKDVEKAMEIRQKEVENVNEAITKVESGETAVSIERVKELTDKMVMDI